MVTQTPLFLAHLVGFAGFLWLGLYVLTHGDRGRVAMMTASTALVTCLYFLRGGLLEAFENSSSVWIALGRLTWWTDVVPLALWLHLSLMLNPQAIRAAWRRSVIWLSYATAAALIVLGTDTDLIDRYVGFRAGVSDPNPAGPAYPLFTLYLIICTGFAVLNFSKMRQANAAVQVPTALPSSAEPSANGATVQSDTPDAMPGRTLSRPELQALLAGAVFFLIGGLYESLRALLHADWNELPAFLLLLAGLGAMGATVVIQSTLLLGKDVRRDFVYSLVGLAALLVPYFLASAALIGFDGSRQRVFAMILVALITAGHTLYDKAREWLDTVFFTPIVREERAAGRAYVESLAIQPVGLSPELATPKAFDDAVRRALSHLSDPTKLATSPLVHLSAVTQAVETNQLEDNRLYRAALLKDLLLELLEALRPGEGTGGITDDAHRYYNCLYYPYVRGISRRRAPTILRQLQERRRRDGTPPTDIEKVTAWLLQVDEDTFYKWQRRGSDAIAASLRERQGTIAAAPPTELPARVAVASGP